MSKVEELRERVIAVMTKYDTTSYAELVDALIAAAKLEQKEIDEADVSDHMESVDMAYQEGVEQERERIREGSQMVGVEKDGVNFVGGVDYVGSAFLVPVDVMDPPASILVPKEEKP